ncbi:MAG: hypothetical protein V3V00_13045 [Saprospiraceae bacterium]
MVTINSPLFSLKHISVVSFLIISLTVFFAYGCVGSKKWKKDIDGPILFGSFGGFVGSYDEYTIHNTGQVFYRSKLRGESTMVHQLKDDIVKSIFERIKTDNIGEESMDEPGNMTYFIKFTFKKKQHHIKWGGQHDPSPQLLDYYNYLSTHINGKNPVM